MMCCSTFPRVQFSLLCRDSVVLLWLGGGTKNTEESVRKNITFSHNLTGFVAVNTAEDVKDIRTRLISLLQMLERRPEQPSITWQPIPIHILPLKDGL